MKRLISVLLLMVLCALLIAAVSVLRHYGL